MGLKYGDWLYWINRKWQTSAKDKIEAIGFAVLIASFGKDGVDCYPTAETLARLSNKSKLAAKRRRARCIELGLLTIDGRTYKDVPKLRISIPPDDEEPVRPSSCFGHNAAICDCSDCSEYLRRYAARFAARRLEQARRASEQDDELWHLG